MRKLILLLSLVICSFPLLRAQEAAEKPAPSKSRSTNDGVLVDGYNKYSVRPIHESDIMYKRSIVRTLDLREPQNRPLFSTNRQITKLLIEAVRKGDIIPYNNDSLDLGRKLTIQEFNERMRMPSTQAVLSEEEKQIALANGDSSVLAGGGDGDYLPQNLYQMNIKEDFIFDKQRSRQYYDIQAITISVPADLPANIKAIEIVVASFSYKELVEKLFKDNPNAIWFNRQNDREHKNLADAFDLRLFSSYIVKVSNPENNYLVDIYGGDQYKGILASQWAAHTLMEYEHNLWEF
ncbi:MAG: gliding motility protein GldN [Cytophagales bacterium]|nr:MAG: gliding motility protein GldN [Cytophagales bacterium]